LHRSVAPVKSSAIAPNSTVMAPSRRVLCYSSLPPCRPQTRTLPVPKFAANLSFIFQEVGFLDRFAAAAACGFKAVEYLSPYEHPPEVIAEQLNRHGLEQALFNMAAGNWEAGERGITALPGREAEFRDAVERALVYAKATKCRLLHAMAGLCPDGRDRAAAET